VRRLLVLLTAGLLAASLTAPAAVSAAGNTFTVAAPNGVDDTAAIQAGLDWCATHGPNCTVQLKAGTYRSSLLLEYNFNGTFKGAGESRTTIQALPNLSVTTGDPWANGACLPNLTTCRLPSFLTFVDGNVTVSGLALDFPATNGTETDLFPLGGSDVTGLVNALEFTGDGAYSALVDHVSVTGRADTAGPTIWDTHFNVLQGIVFDGWLPTAPFPSSTTATRSGSFTVRNSTVETVFDAVVVAGAVTSSKVSITANRIADVDIGIDVGAANSTFDISGNSIAADFADPVEWDHYGVLVEPSGFADLVTRLSQFSITDNKIVVVDTCGCNMFGMWLNDAKPWWGAPAHWFTATVKHNTISLPANVILPDNVKLGIDANNITGATISGNTITSTATGTYEGIGLWGSFPDWLPSTGNTIIANDLSGLTLDPSFSLAKIYLDPYTSDNHVVCAGQGVSVLDQGTGNHVTGCGTANPKGGVHHAFGKLDLNLHRP
jgi:hypothetical protein